MSSTATQVRSFNQVSTRDRRLAAIFAAALGIVILVGAGFAPGVAHSVAHDTRHAAAFPCH